MVYKIRKGALTAPAATTMQTVSAPWFLTHQGEPIDLEIRPQDIAVYDPKASILHIRREAAGYARTITPTVDVTVEHEDGFFDVQFRQPDEGLRFMPSISINQNMLNFYTESEHEGYILSNTAMFEVFCDFMASPIYNPFITPIPMPDYGLTGDIVKRQLFYRAVVNDDDTDPYLGREHEYPIDEERCYFVFCDIQTDRPIAVWDKHKRDNVLLPAGLYRCWPRRWNPEDGEPTQIKLEGKTKDGKWMSEAFVDWAVMATELELGHARVGNIIERQPFDLTPYRPISTRELVACHAAPQEAAASATALSTVRRLGVLRKLIGK